MVAERQEMTQTALPEGAYRALVEAAPDIVAVFHGDGRIRYINAATTALLGHAPTDVVGRPIQDFLHPDDRERAASRIAAVRAAPASEVVAENFRVRCHDGRYRHLETLALNRLGDAAIDGIFLIARDVTRRSEAESERLAAQERRRLTAEVARLGVWEWNLETNELVADEAVRQLVRPRPDQTWTGPEEFLARFHPEDREALYQAIRAAAAGREVCRRVARMPLQDGSLRWLYVYAQRLPGENRPGPWLVGLVMDVTAQKRTEQELSIRGELLELASWGADLGVWTWYPAEDRAVIDERSIQLLGLAGHHTERPTAECNSRVHPDDLATLERLEQELVSGVRERFDYAYRVQRDDPGWHWLLDRGRVSERDGNGRAIRVSGVTLDIDNEKQKERELEEQRLRLDLALKASRLGLWDFDAESEVLYVDARYTEITGLTPEDVRRNYASLTDAVHEDDRRVALAAVAGIRSGSRESIRFEGRLRRQDGRLTWIDIEGFIASRQPDGRPARIIGTIADITARKQLEAALLESSSREQQRLGRELHDGLGQELTGISLLLQGIAGQVKAANPSLSQPFDRLSGLLSSAIRNTRLLAHGLAPVTPARGGLEGALMLLAEHSTASCGLPVGLELNVGKPLPLDERAGNDLYRIAQEALNNAVRHASASTVRIRLATTTHGIELEVLDDGCGIPDDAAEGDGMGLRSMTYRAQGLRGTLEVLRRQEGGTQVRVRVPLPDD